MFEHNKASTVCRAIKITIVHPPRTLSIVDNGNLVGYRLMPEEKLLISRRHHGLRETVNKADYGQRKVREGGLTISQSLRGNSLENIIHSKAEQYTVGATCIIK